MRKGRPSIWAGSCPTSPCASFRRITTFSSSTHPAQTEPAYPCLKRASASTSTTTRTTLSTPSTIWLTHGPPRRLRSSPTSTPSSTFPSTDRLQALYVGIRTDTGGFNFRNISPRAHELVADLLRAGVVPAEVNERINRRGSIEQLRIVGVSLANAVRYGEALISTVENSDYERTGATELDSKESIDQLRTVAGVDVVAHLREVPQGTKGSLRSETVDVGEIARRFGGGGHRLAAGYTTPRRPDEAREELLGILEGVLDLGGGR